MYWIALWPSRDEDRTAWGWWCLQFTPRVAEVEEALLLEAESSQKLFGGRERLLQQLLEEAPAELAPVAWAEGATSLVALALLRLKRSGRPAPASIPDGLGLTALSAAADHLPTLERTGCSTWGELRRLPRGGLSRRFGAGLLQALDAAYGERPERYPWLGLPEVFDLKFELAALASSAPELMWAAQRLLLQLQVWLRARNRGVLALELEWTLDLRRLNGVKLPRHETLVVRTAQPAQDMTHLRRLVSEHLSRATLSAPANHLRLRSLETCPWAGSSHSLLVDESRQGEKLHELVERLSVRLGEGNVLIPQALQDHRPERMQQWLPARQAGTQKTSLPALPVQDLCPAWLLARPLKLEIRNEQPHYEGPLRLLSRLQRIETGWWENGVPVVRDYCIARSEKAGLVWVYREQAVCWKDGLPEREINWYLQGVYA